MYFFENKIGGDCINASLKTDAQLKFLDFVNSTAPFFSPHFSVEEQIIVYRAVISVWGKNSLHSPASIHTAVWGSAVLLFHMCNILSSFATPISVKQGVLNSFEKLSDPPDEVFADQSLDSASRLAVLSAILLDELFFFVWSQAEGALTEISMTSRSFVAWVECVEAVARDVEQLLVKLELELSVDIDMPSIIWSSISTKGSFRTVSDLRQLWTGVFCPIFCWMSDVGITAGILLVKIVAQEILIPDSQPTSFSVAEFLSLAQHPEPLHLSFLISFFGMVSSDGMKVSHAVRRYCTELVFGGAIHLWGQTSLSSAAPQPEPDMVKALVNGIRGEASAFGCVILLLLSDAPAQKKIAASMPRGILTHHFRRSLVFDLVSVKDRRFPGIRLKRETLFLKSHRSEKLLLDGTDLCLESAVLMLDCCEDVSRNQLTCEDVALLARDFDTDICKSGEKTVADYLFSLVAARSAMWEYCAALYSAIETFSKLG